MKPRFGRYRLIGKLAQGGMATLYLARQDGLGGFSKKVVIKRIRQQSTADTGIIKMFFSEGTLAGLLAHPNVVNVYDFAEAEGESYIVMEYVDGPSLKLLITRAREQGKVLPIPHCLKIASQVCEGLAYVQNLRNERDGELLNLVHRDIAPDNILVARSGAVKIVDFGIAKASVQMHQTAPGMVKGKMAYIAPEQLFNEQIDGRADTYSLGVVLFEALTGVSPFMRDNDAAIIDAVLRTELPSASKLRPDLPPALDAILAKATAKKPEDRFASPLELQVMLEGELVKLMPVFTAGRLRELVASLDPVNPLDTAETTTSSEHRLEVSEPRTDVVPLSEKMGDGAMAGKKQTQEGEALPPRPRSVSAPVLTNKDSQQRLKSIPPPIAPPLPPRDAAEETLEPAPSAPPLPSMPPITQLGDDPSPSRRWMGPVVFTAVFAMSGAVAAGVLWLQGQGLSQHAPQVLAVEPVRRLGAPAQPAVAPPPPPPSPVAAVVDAGARPATEVAAVDARAPEVKGAEAKPAEQRAPERSPVAAPAAVAVAAAATDAGAVSAAAAEAPAAAAAPGQSRVTLGTTPAATVWVDGAKAGATPLTLSLAFGAHKLRFESADAGLNKFVLLRVPSQPEFKKEFTFEPAELTIDGPDEAVVYLNKRKVGTLPMDALQLYEGTYTLRVVATGADLDETRTIELKGGDSVQRFGDSPTP